MIRHCLAVAVLGLATAAPLHAADAVPNSAEIVKAANWETMETITIELTEHEFAPRDLKLKAGQPYRLVLKNSGEKDHYYTASEFYQGVAWRKVQTAKPHGGEFKAPYFSAIEVYKKTGQVELFLVPVKKGTFEVICTIDDHKDKGMTGSITVE